MSIQVGDVLGDYQVTGILGAGGMGRVFRVRSLLTEREEAMKVVLPDLAENPALVDRFLREIKVHASLRHPNIATLHTALRIEGRLVMIMELIEGVSLEEKLHHGPIDVPAALGYITQVLSALAFAHEHGVIHRDIKPANILITAGGVVKLTDFGIARSASAGRLTGMGVVVGTIAYMSPEQVRCAPVDARSDIYSVGLTFYELITGRQAIDADDDNACMLAQLNTMPPDPVSVNPRIPQSVSSVIMRALAKDPAHRFQTAVEFEAALRNLTQSGLPATPSAGSISPSELADLESRLSRAIGPIARHLVSDATRRYASISEIRRALAAQIEDPTERSRFLQIGPNATVTMMAPTAAGQPATFDPAALDRMTVALAPFLGPIAKVVVRRAAGNARSTGELESALAAEISSPDDRRRFLASLHSAL